jgi:hypothetical protein
MCREILVGTICESLRAANACIRNYSANLPCSSIIITDTHNWPVVQKHISAQVGWFLTLITLMLSNRTRAILYPFGQRYAVCKSLFAASDPSVFIWICPHGLPSIRDPCSVLFFSTWNLPTLCYRVYCLRGGHGGFPDGTIIVECRLAPTDLLTYPLETWYIMWMPLIFALDC